MGPNIVPKITHFSLSCICVVFTNVLNRSQTAFREIQLKLE